MIVIFMLYCNTAFPYDFSAVSPSGQTLYYNIVSEEAVVTYPNDYFYSGYNHYYGYTLPAGNLIIADSVSYGGQSYRVTGIGQEVFNGCLGLTTLNTYW